MGGKRILLQAPWGNKMLQKMRFYWSARSINKTFYYYHGPAIRDSDLRTCFIEHSKCMAICWVDLCVCLPSLHYFTCWTSSCAFFLPIFLIPLCSNIYVWSAWNFHPVLLLFYSWMYVVTYLSDTPDVLNNFMLITGFLKWACSDTKNKKQKLSCVELITCRMSFYLLV